VPSPIGHVLAGAAVAYAGDAIDRRRSPIGLVATCALLAAAADLDLLLPGYHRSFTHSFTAVAFIFIVAAVVTGEVNTRHHIGRWRVALVCACAYATHLLLDWLGADALPPFGIQVFWPFDTRFFMSGLHVFAETERRHPFSGPTIVQNLWAGAQEVAIVAPIAGALWLVRVKALARLPAKMSRRDHAPQ
jgi:inner membrane protein